MIETILRDSSRPFPDALDRTIWKVTYTSINHDARESMVLMCPQDANHNLARVSLLPPIGLALIGQKVRTIVNVESPFRSPIHRIKIINVKSLMTVDVESAASSGRVFH